jgi:hypothetical protein
MTCLWMDDGDVDWQVKNMIITLTMAKRTIGLNIS